MRHVVLGLLVVAAAFAGIPPSAPSAASSAIFDAAVMEATGGSDLPFRGTLQGTETVAGALHRLNGSGQATHLGRFTLTQEFILTPPTASGTATWTAANGDQIFTTFVGRGVITFPVAAIVETHTITGGTGRFAEASGSLVVERSLNLVTWVFSASITGTISLGN